MTSYQDFLNRKFQGFSHQGVASKSASERLFPFQKTAVDKLLSAGRGAAFLDTGMGKTAIQVEWAKQLGVPTLILCPLAVADQTIHEAAQMLIEVGRVGSGCQIEIVNYERMHQVDTSKYEAVVFDESSIMKSLESKTREKAERAFSHCKYRLACSATPAPNDFLEIGQQSQVLGILRSIDMLSRWFINDSANTGTWRLKGHAKADFWRWVSSWAVVANCPADLGDNETDLSLPPLNEHEALVESPGHDGSLSLFGDLELSATGIRRAKKASLSNRMERCFELANGHDYALIWCHTNDEADELRKIPDAIEVRGNMPLEEKEAKLRAFSSGDERVLVTKPTIAGFGLNWQHCNNVIQSGADYSFERYYQAVRRCWRFGQKRPVDAHVVMAPDERLIWLRVRQKAEQHETMLNEVRQWNSI